MGVRSREISSDSAVELDHCLCEASCLARHGRYRRALALIDEALQKREPVDPEHLVAELRDLRRTLTNERRVLANRALILAAFLVSVLAVGFLQFTHIGSAEVVVDVKTRGVMLKLTEGASLHVEPLNALLPGAGSELATYATGIRIPQGSALGRPIVRLKPDPYAMVLIHPSANTTPHMNIWGPGLGLGRLELQPLQAIDVRSDGRPQATITVTQNTRAGLVARTGETVTVECPGCEVVQGEQILGRADARLMLIPEPTEITVQTRTSNTDIGMILSETAEAGTSQILRISEIAFTSRKAGHVESLIQEGTLRMIDLNDRTIPLGDREFLDIEVDSQRDNLVVSRLSFGKTISMHMEGRVRSLRTGVGQTLHSRIPTRLEWASTNKPLGWFLAGASAIFGFLAAAAARLRIAGGSQGES